MATTKAEQARAYYARNREACKARVAAYQAKHKERLDVARAAYREEHRERRNAYSRSWRAANPEKTRENNLRGHANNPGRNNALNAKRRAAKKQAIPPWADLRAIAQFYKDCPPGMQVDHIYPLQSDWCCGLHVLENLQYLTPRENAAKGNRRVK